MSYTPEFKVGDWVMIREAGKIWRWTEENEVYRTKNCCAIPLTVADAFSIAGFPVPTDARLVKYENGLWIWGRRLENGIECGSWRGNAWDIWVQPSDIALPVMYTKQFPDLGRLPLADAWDSLPNVVREKLEPSTPSEPKEEQ